jgi:hypothetical protein
MTKLYLDGCSLTYGQGLDRKHSLGSWFKNDGGYDLVDQSFPGKSNMMICFDAYQNRHHHDIFVLGFTFSNRFGLKFKNQNLNFYAGSAGLGFGLEPAELDQSHLAVQKYFYTVFDEPYCSDLSDMLIDTTVNSLRAHNKTVIAFSWQNRNTDNKLHYPCIQINDRLPDGHLNVSGMKKLYEFLQNTNGQL